MYDEHVVANSGLLETKVGFAVYQTPKLRSPSFSE
jgi:hypothetical protein